MLTPNTFKKQLDTQLLKKFPVIYLAVSGGVDSLVLYDLIKKSYPEKEIVLLHVNYGLRKEAQKETAYLKELAQKDGRQIKITYYQNQEAFSEEKGRKFRYQFFKEEMTKAGVLLTAHHLNDLGETLLMKLTRGVRLENWRFLPKQPFGRGILYRPLLVFTKEEIYQYANFHHLTYFEDESNQSLQYKRNRYRKEILPLFLKENPNFLHYLFNLNESLLEIETKVVEEFSLNDFLTLSSEKKHIYLKQWLKGQNLTLNASTLQQLEMFLLHSKKTTFTLEHGELVRGENNLYFHKEKTEEKDQKETFVLPLNQWIKLNEKESIGYFSVEKEISLKEGTYHVLPLYKGVGEVLYCRHFEAGDKIKLKKEGYTKKVNRFFIDEKVPQPERLKKWLVLTKDQEVLWVVPNGKSYLSYQSETDKISHRLIYNKIL